MMPQRWPWKWLVWSDWSLDVNLEQGRKNRANWNDNKNISKSKKKTERKKKKKYIYIYIFVAHWTHGLDSFFLIAIIIIKLSIRTTPLQTRGNL